MKKETAGKNKECWWKLGFVWLAKLFGRKNFSREELDELTEDIKYPRENPYLHRLRDILEQILSRDHISYRDFCPLLIDTDTPPESLLDEDQVEIVLEQISQDLNFLRIFTDRPAYFTDYIQRMYEDNGLVVQMCPKGDEFPADANVIIDMEQRGSCPPKGIKEHVLYIPVYKREWCRIENMGNLDISIPIGYNTVIVKGV